MTAIRGERAFVANARFDPPLSIEVCTKPREAAEARLEDMSRAEIKPGQRNDAALQKLLKLREQVEADFRRCFAEHAPKQKAFADAIARAKELLDRMQLQ